MAAGSLMAAEETVEEKIKRLEAMVTELKQVMNEQKSTHEKHMVKYAKQEEAAEKPSAKHSYKFGGFIKTTASWNDYSAGDIGAGSGLRDFYIPGGIPVGGAGEKDFDFSAKESRISWKSTHELESGDVLTTNIEFDFLFPPGGNERVSNSYNPRLRHAYFTYNDWLIGQTWSTFQNVGALPETVDFLGSPEGIIFNRQSVVRYTNGAFQIALENPETTVTPFGGGDRIVTDDNTMPDLVLRYNHKADWGHLTASALFRQLAYDNGSTIDDTESSVGFSLSGKFKVGANDDIRFNFQTGSGMGRYAGLNTANGAVLDASNNLHAIDSTNGSIAYRHVWGDGWRSNFIFSTMDIDNDASLTGTSVTEKVDSFQVNLLYSPVAKLTLGVGYLDATRELNSGAKGDLSRLMFTAKYAF